MRIGTLKCWLFGHLFLAQKNFREDEISITWDNVTTSYCVRCGVSKE